MSIIERMVIDMNEAQVRTLEQVRQVLEGTQALEFRRAEDDQGRYGWIDACCGASTTASCRAGTARRCWPTCSA